MYIFIYFIVNNFIVYKSLLFYSQIYYGCLYFIIYFFTVEVLSTINKIKLIIKPMAKIACIILPYPLPVSKFKFFDTCVGPEPIIPPIVIYVII